MGRTMPTQCPHGAIIDGGSFGADDGSSLPEDCAECRREESPSYYDRVEWMRRNGLDSLFGVGCIQSDGNSRTAYSCGVCGALTVEPHVHAEWHMRRGEGCEP